MTLRIAINGFGRIGRLALRGVFETQAQGCDRDIEIVAINGRSPVELCAHLLEFDSTHGRFSTEVSIEGNDLLVGGHRIHMLNHGNPSEIPWGDHGVDVVLECSGKFNNREAAAGHLRGGARRVLVSAPASGADNTVVYGVNHSSITADHLVVSNASCTTNCIAPIAMVLHREVGLVRGYMTTIHSYTRDQPTLDASHKDYYRARAAAANIVPTSTGAAKAIGLVLPELTGRLQGSAIRVPTPNVSLIDLSFEAAGTTSAEEINAAMMRASSSGDLVGVLGYNDRCLVSSDFNHDPHSSIFDAKSTVVMDGTFARVVSWYDNEWAFALRMLDVARVMGKTL